MRKRAAGFTLVEVLVALAIIATVIVVLLGRRVEILEQTGRARDQRLAWALAAQKMADVELDPYLFQGEGGGKSGDFRELGDEYAGFVWEWDAAKEEVASNDPTKRDEKAKQIFRVKLVVKKEGEKSDLVSLEAMFPIQKKSSTP